MAALKVSTAIGEVSPTGQQSACGWSIWVLPPNEKQLKTVCFRVINTVF
jgi:hypothetical protein